MKFLIIGIGGSMGRRRIRALKALGYSDIWGYDKDSDVALTVYKECEVNVCYNKEDLLGWLSEFVFDAVLVCTPPSTKQEYIRLANDGNIPCFIEADIRTYKGEYYPSRTMIHHPAIKMIKEMIDKKELGQIHTFNYHMGQHIRDWHKGADYSNYYAAKKDTGACKEMFCFEVAWLSWLFGEAHSAVGFIDKQLNDKEVSADDVFATSVKFNQDEHHIIGTVLIDIVSRPAIRELRIVCEKGIILWNWEYLFIQVLGEGETCFRNYERNESAEGYNENIPEAMYVLETKNFIEASQKLSEYLYSQEEEMNVIHCLQEVLW